MAFESTTVQFAGVRPNFSWSYSRLKNFRACRKRHFHYDIAKDVREPEDDGLDTGFKFHAAMAARVKSGTPLPPLWREYEPYAAEFLKGVTPTTKVLVEDDVRLAIDRNFQPSNWKDSRKTWFRAICDVVKMEGPVAVNWDWKTGKVREDPLQIKLSACMLFHHFPELQVIRNEFIWVNHAQRSGDRYVMTRADINKVWADIIPEVNEMEQAAIDRMYPPKQNGLCREYCAVGTCQFHPDYNK